MLLLLTIGFLYLFFSHTNLSTKVRELEEKIAREKRSVAPQAVQQSGIPPIQVAQSASVSPSVAPTSAPTRLDPIIPLQTPQAVPQPHVPTPPNPLIEWLSENTLIKIGALLFFLGAVWFVSYAISEGWISLLMRILLGISLGIGVLAVGWWRRNVEEEQYLVLTTLGVGIIIASIYAGQFLYKLFPISFALSLVILTIAYAVWVSVQAKREWLCVLAAVAALTAPILVNASITVPSLFLLYLLAVTCAFLGVVFLTNWRTVTLALLVGTSFFLWAVFLQERMQPGMLWLFVIVFTLVFYVASSVSMYRNNKVASVDILTLGISIVAFVGWTHALVVIDGLATFVAALITCLTGYMLYAAGKSEKLVSVYAGMSTILLLVATAFTFEGYTLTMVYTLEVAVALMLSMHLRLPQKATILTACAFALPLLTSTYDIIAPEWNVGVTHGSAIAIYTIVLATALVSMYAISQSRKTNESLYQAIGGVFGFVFWLYACLCAWLVWGSLFSGGAALTLQYVSWAVISVLMLTYVVGMRLPSAWQSLVLVSFVLPLLVSINSIWDVSWKTSASHPAAFGLYFMTLLTLGLALWGIGRGLRATEKDTLLMGGGWMIIFWLYALTTLSLLWSAIFQDLEIANVLRYVSWGLVSYALVQGALHFRVPTTWLVTALLSFTLPVLASLSSFTSYAWAGSFTHAAAIGLYTLTTLLLLTALSLSRNRVAYHGDQVLLTASIPPLWVLTGLYLIALVWRIAHAVFLSPDVAVSVALFVYTVTGLALYSLGKSHHMEHIRYAGVLLLGGVVARLLIIDVWNMEMLGRIVTFLGVGFLFILTALFEKPFKKVDNEEKPAGENLQ